MNREIWSRLLGERAEPEPAVNPSVPAPRATAGAGAADKSRGIHLAVDDVTPAADPIATESLAASVEGRLQRKIVALPAGEELVINKFPRVDKATGRRYMPRGLTHPLIDAIHLAFSEHRPLTLSPDAIWLVIAQGFGHHVLENAEQLRARLVRHQGKKGLQVEVSDLKLPDFQAATASFSEQIRQETDHVLHETLVCDFSTTSPDIRTASEVALMDTFSSYFTYALMCVCGIPKITIEGTSADWKRIRDRVEVLATYGLEWWVSRLRAILDEFVAAAEGRPRADFWKAIYKPKAAYATEVVTGWIADLFPYLGDPPGRQRNPIFASERRDWLVPVDYGVNMRNLPVFDHKSDSGVASKQFPSGISSVRLHVTLPDLTKSEFDLLGGFMAIRQDETDLSLSPVIGWCVAELPSAQPIVVV